MKLGRKIKGSEYIGTLSYTPILSHVSVLTCTRAVYLDALVAVVEPQSAHFNKRCVSIVPSLINPSRLLINFSDGTSHEADVVVGADGIRSTVREYLLGDGDKRVAFSNTVAYRGLIPYKDLQAAGFETPVTQDPACFVGPSKVGIWPFRSLRLRIRGLLGDYPH